MELFPITLPKKNICTETELYYRCEKAVYDEAAGTITIPKKAILTLDTYFNCFSYSKYLQYTYASVLEVHLRVQGEVQLRLMKAELNGKKVQRITLLTQNVQRETLDDVILLYDFSKETGDGFIYLEVTALSKTAVFAGGFYASPVIVEQINHTKLATVICTYKREEYVKRNLGHINKTIFISDDEIAEHLEIFVIDNGQTLQHDDIENCYITLYPNKNCGGSGGFTRGIIEALKRNDEFSHVLLMDDDVLLESNVLIKTIRFLQIVRTEHADLVLGGSMLRLDAMTVQHEAGGRWTGIHIQHGNHNLSLIETISLLKNEALEQPQYNAWWYCCIPLCMIDEQNLPLPFFIKMDDIEYGMRMMKKLMVMNGIGIWHEPFENKQVPQLDYYDVRNKLVVNTLYEDRCLLLKNLFLVMRYMGKNMLKGNPKMAVFAVKGCEAYLQGIKYFEQIDLEKLHKEINEKYKNISQDSSHGVMYYWSVDAVQYMQLAIKLIMKTKTLKRQYRNEMGKITSETYWINKLEC